MSQIFLIVVTVTVVVLLLTVGRRAQAISGN